MAIGLVYKRITFIYLDDYFIYHISDNDNPSCSTIPRVFVISKVQKAAMVHGEGFTKAVFTFALSFH